jgi:hypothetical protein
MQSFSEIFFRSIKRTIFNILLKLFLRLILRINRINFWKAENKYVDNLI